MSSTMAFCVCLLLPLAAWAQAVPASAPGPDVPRERLRAALAIYQSIEEKGGWPLVPPGPVLENGVDDPRVVLLRRRLATESDLAEDAIDGSRFDRRLEVAVIRFQARHGLEVDGRVGANTYRALNVPAEARVAQIAANLARWADVPADLPARRLEINIPSSELALFEDGRQIAGMRVIVGTSRNPTPVLQSQVVAVVFNPPWNVPASIARNEILPRLAREPGYLRQNDIRIVDRPADPYGEEIDWSSPDRPSGVRLQQQPGPKNALGRIKFDIPNAYAVYLHDTPNKAAFQREARALSHGCIRLQDPESLARYVLRDALRADPALVDRALASEQTMAVPVPAPLPVFTFYRTAFVTPDGQVQFRADIYGQDANSARLMVSDATGRGHQLAAHGTGCASSVRAG